MVCDPSYESLQLAKKIKELGENIQKPVYYILNKVQESNEQILRDAIDNRDHILAVLPMMRELMELALKGEKLEINLAELDKVTDRITGVL
ncbi:hypothetical protein DES36_1317 [Alkalibaculum bacchi]|uniref:Uncharacterized protein n=1 Tax=Alkalibaculum bacchi TaxID=645887 RepID=A0A366HY59_9FIRM|nr:hypothetical protein [Alkalibaculum bacchi]RBP57215.1 hypothetical protein DES36_1317 [Alkalibaculum bacchi]